MRAGSYSGVDLNANLAVEIEVEMFLCESEEILDLFGCQVGRSAAAPVELDYGAIVGDAAADALHFLFEDVKIRRCNAFVFLNDDIAGAEKAKAFTEGNVHVKRNGCAGALGFFVHALEISGAESIVPYWRCRIAGVTRAGAIVFRKKVLADVELAAHLVQTQMCKCHAECLLPYLGGRPCMLNQRALARLDKELSILDRRILQNAVAKVQDVAVASQGVDGGQGYIANFFGRRKQNGRVDIALESDSWTKRLANLSEVHTPIDAEHIRARACDGGEQMLRRLGVINHGNRAAE